LKVTVINKKTRSINFTFTHPSPPPYSRFCIRLKSKKHETDPEAQKMEHCKNPWKEECKSENIKLYIQLKGENLPICQQCWTKIAEQEEEW
jgi:hypothetical protein